MMTYEHCVKDLSLNEPVPDLDAASAEGWELVALGPTGVRRSALVGAPPTAVVMGVFRRPSVTPADAPVVGVEEGGKEGVS